MFHILLSCDSQGSMECIYVCMYVCMYVSKIRDKCQYNNTSSMAVNDTTKLFMYWYRVIRLYVQMFMYWYRVIRLYVQMFMYWYRVIRLYVQIAVGVKTGWDCQIRQTYGLHSWYQYFMLVAVKWGVCMWMMFNWPSSKERWAWLLIISNQCTWLMQ